jgi:hypothetical protein
MKTSPEMRRQNNFSVANPAILHPEFDANSYETDGQNDPLNFLLTGSSPPALMGSGDLTLGGYVRSYAKIDFDEPELSTL